MISAVALDVFFVDQQSTGHQKYRAFATISLKRKLGFKKVWKYGSHNDSVIVFHGSDPFFPFMDLGELLGG